MSSTLKTNLLKYGITSVVGIGMVWLYFLFRVESFAELAALEPVALYQLVCDAFTIPGMIIPLMGCMVWLSNEGALDGVSYAVSFAVRMLIPGMGGHERYGDYLERKRANRVKGYGFLFIVGGVFLAVALIFLALYQSVC